MPSLVLAYVFGFMVLVSAHEAAARPKVQCPWARSPGELPNPLQRLKNWIPILPHPRALWVRGLAIGPAKRRGRTWLKDVKGGVKSDLDQVTYPGHLLQVGPQSWPLGAFARSTARWSES